MALDAATGELQWMHSEDEGKRGEEAPRQLSGRGLAYWSDGRSARIIYVTPGYRMKALDAKTGAPITVFGKNGVVDLKLDNDQEMDLVTGDIGLHAAPVIARDVVIIGAAHTEGSRPEEPPQRQRLRARLRRAHRQAPVDLPHDSRAAASSAPTRGRRTPRRTPATPASGRR